MKSLVSSLAMMKRVDPEGYSHTIQVETQILETLKQALPAREQSSLKAA